MILVSSLTFIMIADPFDFSILILGFLPVPLSLYYLFHISSFTLIVFTFFSVHDMICSAGNNMFLVAISENSPLFLTFKKSLIIPPTNNIKILVFQL